MASHPLSWIGQLALPRLTLLLNHVVSSEPVAAAKLQAHRGRTIDIRWVSAFSPAVPAFLSKALPSGNWAPAPVRLRITPAGLFEADEPESAGHLDTSVTPSNANGLTITVHLIDPLTMARRALKGERPEVNIEGDAALAEVASWLMKNLRWDIQDDLARWLGHAPAELLRTVGDSIRHSLQRWRPQGGDQTPGAGTR